MKPILVFLFASAVLLLFNSCKDNGSEPQERKIKSPLDMTWSYEVLTSEGIQLNLNSMYASDYKDIWLTGHNSEGNKNLWHYNGINWVSVDPLAGNELGAYGLRRLFGFASNNIWLVGGRYYGPSINEITKPLIMNYNGNRWVEHKQNLMGGISAIAGDSPTNIWACGDGGLVLHYDGNKWVADTIKIKGAKPERIWFSSVQIYNGKPLFLGNENDVSPPQITNFYVTGDINNWTVVDSNDVIYEGYKAGDLGFYLSKTAKLYSYGEKGIWEWVNNKWESFYSLTNNGIIGLTSINDDYMIGVGDKNYAAFFDGVSWKQITQVQNTPEKIQFRDVWTDGTEAFLVGYSIEGFPNKTYIWRGK